MSVHTSYSGEIAAQLADYRVKGQKEAAAHRPPSDATHMDLHETSLQAQAERWLTDEQRFFDFVLTESSRAVVEVGQKAVELRAKVDQLISDRSLIGTIQADMSADRQALIAATESRMRAEVDWRAFRAANNITEQASYPESHIWHFSLIALLALIETAVNAFFYENAQGLLGGFFVALGVAALNMGGAMVLGMGFRFKNLSAPDKKLFGWFCLVAFLILSIYCNALFSAFRGEYQLLTDPTDPLQLRQAFATAVSESKRIFVLDMRVADLMSFVLFGIGLILSGVAFWKGYTFDDRFPGHGKKDRSVKAAQRAEVERQDLLRQKVKDFLHHRRAEVQAAVHEPTQLISRTSSRIAELEHARVRLGAQAQAIQRDFTLVLDAYRQANTAVRATDPPAYFKEVPKLAHLTSVGAATEVAEALSKAQDEVKSLREEHQNPLNEKLRALQGDAANILNRTIGDFLKEIDAEAQERINRMTPTIHRAGTRTA